MARLLGLGPLRLDIDAGALTHGDRVLPLGRRGVALLHALATQAGQYVSKARLMEAVWPGLIVGDNNLTVQIAAIRRVLSEVAGGEAWIETLARRGYRYIGPAALDEAPPGPGGRIAREQPALVGRHRELEAVTDLLAQHRLLTLTGPGGIGKTRLAQALAADPPGDFPDGVFTAFLDSVTDAALVPSVLARVLHVNEGAESLADTLARHVARRRMLIVLDNCEHVAPAASHLATALLAASEGLRIVATSREPLRAAEEHRYEVPPLALPQEGAAGNAILAADAVRLFVARARAQRADLALTPGRIATLATICSRLDGLPLAIELAAARVRSLSLEQIVERIDDRFRLLTGGTGARMSRQQTLRATLDWSYDLLAMDECVVLRRVAVFEGGFDLDAAGAVASDDELDAHAVVDVVQRLVQRSLVVREQRAAGERYRLLETTRAYAREKLGEADEAGSVRARHAAHYERFFAPAPGDWSHLPDARWMDRYLPELDNARAAVAFSYTAEGSAATGVALTATSHRLWRLYALRMESRERLDAALARIGPDTPPGIVGALWAWVGNWWDANTPQGMLEATERAVRAFEQAGDIDAKLDAAFFRIHLLSLTGHFDAARDAIAALPPFDEASLSPRTACSWNSAQGYFHVLTGNRVGGIGFMERALAIARAHGFERITIQLLANIADVAWTENDSLRAEAHVREGLALAPRLPMPSEAVITCQFNLIGLLVERKELGEALDVARRCNAFRNDMAVAWQGIDHLALRCALGGRLEDAVRLAGYADARHAAMSARRQPNEGRARDRLGTLLHGGIDPDRRAALLAEGALLSDDAACALALAG